MNALSSVGPQQQSGGEQQEQPGGEQEQEASDHAEGPQPGQGTTEESPDKVQAEDVHGPQFSGSFRGATLLRGAEEAV